MYCVVFGAFGEYKKYLFVNKLEISCPKGKFWFVEWGLLKLDQVTKPRHLFNDPPKNSLDVYWSIAMASTSFVRHHRSVMAASLGLKFIIVTRIEVSSTLAYNGDKLWYH